jgi:hypothetical protein
MELAIVGAVGLLGYTMSAAGKQPRFVGREHPVIKRAQAYPWGPNTDVQKAFDADRQATQARWEQSQQPQLTGVVSPNTRPNSNTMPFFSSASKQHTNTDYKQRRMEMFTGATDMRTSLTGTYARKQEVPSMFKPEWTAGAVNSSGSTVSSPFGADLLGRYIPSMKQNNVLPTEQIRVGRGVGVGIDVPASDGFHPMLRVMPPDLGFKKNILPGGFVPGAAPIAARPMPVQMVQTKPPTTWSMDRYPLAPGKAAVNAATNRPTIVNPGCGGRLVGDEYYGAAARGGAYTSSTQPTRNRFDNNQHEHNTNLTGARHGLGGFANADHDMTRFNSQQREQFETYNGVLTGAAAPAADPMHLLQQTQRSLRHTEIMGNPASVVEGGRARPMDAVDRTLREHMHPQSQPGVATPYLKGHSVTGTHKWFDRESKRYGQHLVNWMPPAHMATDVRLPGLVEVKQRLQPPNVAALPTTPTPIAMVPLGQSTTPYNKLPPTNTRLDLRIASDQLKNNDLHVAINR